MSIPKVEKSEGHSLKRKMVGSVEPEAKRKSTNNANYLIAENKRLLEKIEALEYQADYKKKMERFIECGIEELEAEIIELKTINRDVSKKCENYSTQMDYLVDVVRKEKLNAPQIFKTEYIDEVLTNSTDVYEDLKEIVPFEDVDGIKKEELYVSMTLKVRCESCNQTCKEMFCGRCNSGICTFCYEILQCFSIDNNFVKCPSCDTDAIFKSIVVPD